MLPLRLRLGARELLEKWVAWEPGSPAGRSLSSSESARCLVPSSWGRGAVEVVGGALCLVVEEFRVGFGKVGSLPRGLTCWWCWASSWGALVVETVVGAERKVLEGERGGCEMDGSSEMAWVFWGGVAERRFRSATASRTGGSISRCVCDRTDGGGMTEL